MLLMFMVAVVPTLAVLVVESPEPGAQLAPSQVPQAAAWAAAGASDSISAMSKARYIFFINFLSACDLESRLFEITRLAEIPNLYQYPLIAMSLILVILRLYGIEIV